MAWYDPARLASLLAITGPHVLSKVECGKVVRRLKGCVRNASQRNAEYAVGPQGYGPTGKIIYNPSVWVSNTGEQLTDGFGWVFRDKLGDAIAVTQYAKTDAEYAKQVSTTAASYGLDPAKVYATGRFDNPAGNSGKDIVYILYSIDSAGSATPLRVTTVYYASGWVDGTRAWAIQMAQMVVTIYTAGLGSAEFVDPDAVGSIGLTQSQQTAITFTAQQAAPLNKDIGLAGKLVGSLNGKIGATQVGEDDFGDDFGSFDYSSGESETAFSDAENVDYGFGADTPGTTASDFGQDAYDIGSANGNADTGLGADAELNGTAESGTSDYGSSSQGNPNFDSGDAKALSDGVSVAGTVAKVSGAGATGGQVSGGGQKMSQTATTLGSVLTGVGKSQGSAPQTSGIGGLLTQIETLIPKSYAGQLGPNKSAPQGHASSNNMLIIGAALIGVFLVLHFHKG